MQEGDVNEYLASLKASKKFGPQVAYHKFFPLISPVYGDLDQELSPELEKVLHVCGVSELYSHQVRAINLIRDNKDVIVATSTASGKSLIYNIPVLEEIIVDPAAGALYLFPLKALARSQLRVVEEIVAGLTQCQNIRAAVCDGDTSVYKRKKIRENPPNILISNPDMLHLSILGYHANWSLFWQRLRYVVIDEVHTYRGVFGSHMAWVIRRMQRICNLHGADPRFLLFSATIGNPEELAEGLIGRPVEKIVDSGAPQGKRHFVLFDPWDSPSFAASQMLEAALKRGLRTIVYTQSRKVTELVASRTLSRLGSMKEKLTAYRAGFLPEERRVLEERLASGELMGVVSTSALELGIDIGSLDICILVGYPGSIMSTWQRGGRVGRRQRDCLIIMIAQEDSLDQHFIQHPEDFFERKVEDAVLNPHNEVISRRHILCAAAESPIAVNESILENSENTVEKLASEGGLFLNAEGDRWVTGRRYPHKEVDIRGSGSPFVIREDRKEKIIGEIDGYRCQKECHPGALYLHNSKTWVVKALDLNDREVRVRRQNVPWFTRPLTEKTTEILEVYESTSILNILGFRGRLRVTEQVTGYQQKLVRGQKIIACQSLDLPPQIFETEGLWLLVPVEIQAWLQKKQMHFMGGIHALEHVLISLFPLLVLCDRNDVGGISEPFNHQLNKAAIFIYDGCPGGIGLSRSAFLKLEELLQKGLKTINSCSCDNGCPGCVHSPRCGSGNRPIDKEAAREILEGLLAREGWLNTTVMNGLHSHFFRHKASSGTVNGIINDGCPVKTEGGGQRCSEDLLKNESVHVKQRDKMDSRYAVFDLETKHSASEVGGWHRAEKMGISVAVLYDSGDDQYHIYKEQEIDSLIQHIRQFDLVVGFNNKRFDNRVLAGYTSFTLAALPSLDILEEVKKRLGYRLSLDLLGHCTLGVQKSANGLLALKWYKEGRLDKIIEYCRKDVEITRDLYLYGLKHRYLLFRNKAGHLVRCPVNFQHLDV